MNPSEASLYPLSYFCDMAFFVTKSMTHIFRTASSPSQTSDSHIDFPPTLFKSDIPLIGSAVGGCFESNWEFQLYNVILEVFQRAMLDESVPIGTVVLLDLLGDLHKMGQHVDGEHSKCILPPYPHEDYARFFKGAFMLAFRLLRKDWPIARGYWEDVLQEDVGSIEKDFRKMLDDNLKLYAPHTVDPLANEFHYNGHLVIPANAYITRLRYLQAKSTMYAHIRVLMTSRGENILEVDPLIKWAKDLALHFPPCHEHMMEVLINREKRD